MFIGSFSTLVNCLFRSVCLTKNPDIDKYKSSRYGIGFDRGGYFSFPSDGVGSNVIIFVVDMSSSVHVDNKWKDSLIGLAEYVYDFYVAVDDILDIHNYLMKRNDTV